jgi:hypothetical protein
MIYSCTPRAHVIDFFFTVKVHTVGHTVGLLSISDVTNRIISINN